MRALHAAPAPVCRWSVLVIVVLAGSLANAATGQVRPLQFGRVFADHAVFQRETPVRVWGTGSPGETVALELAGRTAETRVDETGGWSARLASLPAGGPYVLTARGSRSGSRSLDDILVGDVYLCSGQSNMVLQVSRTQYAGFEAMRATDGRIRMVTLPNESSPTPLDVFSDSLAWQVASPETVPGWSATCYYMARGLRNGPLADEDVPVGLITAAWGGSSIRPWMDSEALASVGGYDLALETLRLYTEDQPRAQQAFGKTWQDWWLAASGRPIETAEWLPGAGKEWKHAPEGLGDWTRWDDLRGFTGMVWFRATVHLTAEQASGDATLALGAVDEVDQTWINGNVIANSFGYGTERTYPIPSTVLQEGENVLVVNVLNTYATGGLIGDPSVRALHLADGSRIPLADWRYLPVRTDPGPPPRAPWEAVGGLSTIHNAMVAPLRNFGLRGVVWYQGESDTGSGSEYRALLRGLMGQWRRQFGTDPVRAEEAPSEPASLPVFVVQLPNFGSWPTEPYESGWAEVREAQRLATLDDRAAATVVTIDVGEAGNLHPPNKQAVGARLARAARKVVYGEEIIATGPVPVRAERRGDLLVVSFRDVEGALVAYAGAGPLGFELCGIERDSCRYVNARVVGNEVHILVDDDLPTQRVRHAWADSPIVTLFDTAGLPVGPFELPVESGR